MLLPGLKTRMEKVLFLARSREFGGLEVVLLDWLSRVDYTRASVTVCCYGTTTFWEKLAATGFPVEGTELTIPENEPRRKAFPQWRRLFASIRPDKIIFLEAVVSDFNATPVLAARCSARDDVFLFEANWGRSIDLPSSAKKRNLHYGFLPGVGLYRLKETLRQKLRGRLARRTFVVSQSIKDNLVSHYGYPAARTSVLYHGVDTQRFQASPTGRLEFRRAHSIPDDAIVIVSHGRLVVRKRVDRILKAFETLSAEQPNLWLLLTCYGPLKDKIEKLAAASRGCPRIKLVGFQQNSSLILAASDIYVLSSNDEGFGIALIEALATGLVCVATDGPGPRDIIANGENGFLVDASDEGVLSGMRQALRLDPDARARLIKQARKTVDERFEIAAAIRRALDAMGIPHR
jgi:glycosyltransferase involved in cell wall biosynthesis